MWAVARDLDTSLFLQMVFGASSSRVGFGYVLNWCFMDYLLDWMSLESSMASQWDRKV